METLRTKPINGDQNFTRLSHAIDRVLSNAGFRLKAMEGSISWLGTARTGRDNATIFKLCHFSANHLRFGVRRDFVDSFETLRDLAWPNIFAVAPQSEVAFCGFKVANDDASRGRISRVLKAMNLTTPVQLEADEERLQRFDEQLDQLR